VGSTEWLSLENIDYVDQHGIERTWSRCVRTSKKGIGLNGVTIFPIIRSNNWEKAKTVLVKQYRPPLENYTIELPAGLIDENESPEKAAIRELKEETGFVGKIEDCKEWNSFCMMAGMTNETNKLMIVNVDGDLDENEHLKQKLDEGEYIECIIVDINDLPNTIKREQQNGYLPTSYLCALALGLSLQNVDDESNAQSFKYF